MVDRCRDCGFDLAGGLVEVVPTAHYMMGGAEFAPLLASGEDASFQNKVHLAMEAKGFGENEEPPGSE
mgnify:CR=1 FL=1